ncbi:V-type proton ATPase 116 kDa subunit a 1-like [Ornithodoros turicata]|uniref:V-type proton ATPase 116 kDa subunit a 1-like n=1 Tax=Ornithodoros turicata TaxID=34597 RepID=UPI003139BD09
MGTLFRSEPMTLCQLFIQSESVFNCVSELGQLGIVQFRDLNPSVSAFQRKFVGEIRRCDDVERKLRYVEKEICSEKISIPESEYEMELPQERDMTDLEALVSNLEAELREVNQNNVLLQRSYVELTEIKHVLKNVDSFLEHDESTHEHEMVRRMTEDGRRDRAPSELHVEIGFVAGVILTEKFSSFERMLWRVSRGTVFIRRVFIDTPIEDPNTGDPQLKSVFVVFYQGEQLNSRIKKICDAYHARRYAVSSSKEERRDMTLNVLTRLEDLKIVRNKAQEHRVRMLSNAAKEFRGWLVKAHKLKAVYHALNLFNVDITHKCLIGEAWCPESELEEIQRALKRGTDTSQSHIPCVLNRLETTESPPTYNRTNKFTRGFQAIVNAYGVSTYQEVNPAPYTIITFPFLFAVMFGDAGHGLLMLLFALFLVLREKSLQKIKGAGEIWDTFFNGRYIILLMGLFSIYTGLIYNDVFSKSLNIFGSSWKAPVIPFKNATGKDQPLQLDPTKDYIGTPYPFGLDPVWFMAFNKIPFTNSYKMKVAVILGVLQMFFGVILNLWNHMHFKDRTSFPPPSSQVERFLRQYLKIWTEFIPEVVFLLSIFGYLVALIIYKWTLPDGAPDGGIPCSRSLLIHFINMFTFSYPDKPCYVVLLYSGQRAVQTTLLVLALLSVPWLLMARPLYLLYLSFKHRQPSTDFSSDSAPLAVTVDDIIPHEQAASPLEESTANSSMSAAILESEPEVHTPSHKDHFDFGEEFIHQIIHTIEYCLGAVSNTASYLRLWALSLAHSQLSEVLWQMVMRIALGMSSSWVGAIALFAIFTAWAILTVGILLLMEGLSAFLHALRLHWVEFMNKFFKGEGYLFEPFSFREVVAAIDEQF